MAYRKGETRSTAKKVGGLGRAHKKHSSAAARSSLPTVSSSAAAAAADSFASTSTGRDVFASDDESDVAASESTMAQARPVKRKKGKKFASEKSSDLMALAMSISEQQSQKERSKVEQTKKRMKRKESKTVKEGQEAEKPKKNVVLEKAKAKLLEKKKQKKNKQVSQEASIPSGAKKKVAFA